MWCNISAQLPWLQTRGNKLNTTLFDRYYSQNRKSITFRKVINDAKYKKTNAPSHLYFSWLSFPKANHSFLHPFCLGGNRFSKKSPWSFEWGNGAWVKMHRLNEFSRNVNIINWKIFPTHGGIYKLEKIQQAFWREITPWGVLKNMKGCILDANLKG